ncbi:MAG: hypothetical protein NC927_00250 [Candidatus Omnitrophica bacterium]|nr:hypothetical protein [Candidatus Omnitrophota bacterium]
MEKIRGRAISVRTQETISRLGITLLIILMIFVFYNDLIRFQILEKIMKFWKR